MVKTGNVSVLELLTNQELSGARVEARRVNEVSVIGRLVVRTLTKLDKAAPKLKPGWLHGEFKIIPESTDPGHQENRPMILWDPELLACSASIDILPEQPLPGAEGLSLAPPRCPIPAQVAVQHSTLSPPQPQQQENLF